MPDSRLIRQAVAGQRKITRRRAYRFRRDLRVLLNTCQQENGSDTPDYILARYLEDCLRAFDRAVVHRSRWYIGAETKTDSGKVVKFA